jgi:ribosomal protein S18 acetylase RimI-like enzyme
MRQASDAEPNEGVRVRPGESADAGGAGDLIYLPMGRLADYLFGSDDAARAREVLGSLFARPHNRFSYEFSDVLEIDAQVVGLVVGYHGAVLSELAVPTGRELRRILSWGELFRLLKRSVPLMGIRETEPDEFYVYTLAIQPDFQSRGLGGRLLEHAQNKARAAGLRKCSLGVTMDNERAVKFYQRRGYEVVDTMLLPKLENRIGYPGYYRMVKYLT